METSQTIGKLRENICAALTCFVPFVTRHCLCSIWGALRTSLAGETSALARYKPPVSWISPSLLDTSTTYIPHTLPLPIHVTPFVNGAHLLMGPSNLPMTCLASCNCLNQNCCCLMSRPYNQSPLSYISGGCPIFKWHQHNMKTRIVLPEML
jgi:hypothetical protein